ncbi:TetR/AcrR family transcriptional regulator [Pseudonocardia sp. CA-107938]|uniref:TetR/AcrR family transcriptional regulator n=1 Tax=Pseudonocardia sp. CA-107938 TaxID=3240021 RepID=UPI003D94FEB5
MTARLPHDRRVDARRNRDRILGAAGPLFASHGFGVPMRVVAEVADVGPATVYRHFPTKALLVAAVFTEQSRAWESALGRGLTDPDPWRGFRRTVADLCALHADDRGFSAAVKSEFPRAADFAGMRLTALRAGAELIRRAQVSGHLRADVTLADLILMTSAAGRSGARTPAERSATAQRLAALTIRAFQAAPST